VGGTVTGTSIALSDTGFSITVGATGTNSYFNVSPNTSGGVAVNSLGFASAASSGFSGWVTNMFPKSDNAYSIGEGSYRWTTVFATTGTINTSDARLKKDITDSSLGLDFIRSLKPVSYKWIDQNNSGTYWGLLAQDVKQSVKDSGIESFAGLVEDNDTMGLRYTEFIAPIIKAIQEVSNRLDKMEGK
jgi:hypothetical protein